MAHDWGRVRQAPQGHMPREMGRMHGEGRLNPKVPRTRVTVPDDAGKKSKNSLAKSKEKPVSTEWMQARQTQIANLSEAYQQAANQFCSTKAERDRFLAEFISTVRSRELEVPMFAPELYAERANKQEKAPDFIRRVYGPWIGKGLSQPVLLQIDKQLYTGLHNWLRNNKLPDDLPLPTKTQMLDQELDGITPDDIRAVQRLATAGYRRMKNF